MADSKRKRGGKGNATGGAKKDDSARFAADDARWGRQGGKGEGRGGKVRLDARFADLFTNPDFAETFELDPLGRPVKAEESTAQRLRRVYELDPDVLEKANQQQQQQQQEGEVEAEAEADAEAKQPKKKAATAAKKATAAAKKTATQKKTKTTTTKKKAAAEPEEAAAEPEAAAAAEEEEEEEGEETRRLAVCKCDWDKVRAVDILVLLQSFVPATGAILGVTVYPSRLGQQRLDEEAKHGPQSIFRQKGGSGSHHHHNNYNNRRPRGAQSGDIDEEKLRQYELEKLDYYYAVVECDSAATAGEIYKSCDGLEFERSSNVLDLSFIPDDVTFDLPPRESAREIPSNYEAPTYYTSALQHSKVELTWDADDTHRRRVMTQKAKLSAEELKMSDFKAYLASDSDESDLDDDEGEGEPQFVFELETPAGVEETAAAAAQKKKAASKKKSDEKIDPKRRDKYRALLGALDQDEEEQQDMEITFVPGLSEKVQGLLDAKDNPDALKRKRKREPAPKTLESDEDSDFFEGAGEFDGDRHSEDEEAERRKRGGKKKARGGKKTEEERRQEAELALLTIDEDIHRAAHKRTADDATAGGKPKGRSARRAKAREEAKAAADLDLKDPRFRELVTSAEFAIDPTRIKKNSETVNKILVERSRVRAETAGGAAASSEAKTAAGGGNKGPFSDSSLSALVSSVKVKGLGPAKGRKGRAATTTTTVTTGAKRSK